MRYAALVVMTLAMVVSTAMGQQVITVDPEDPGSAAPPSSAPEQVIVVPPSAAEETQSPPAAMTRQEGERESAAGPAGATGASGARGVRGHRGARGSAGPPGKDADPQVVARLVLAELEKSQRGEAVEEWAKPFLDELIAEKLVLGYPDGTIRPREKPDFQRVVTVIGRIQQQLREQLKAEALARTAEDKKNERLIELVVVFILCLAIAGLLVGIKNKYSR